MSSTDGCAIFGWLLGIGLDQKKIKINFFSKYLSALQRYNIELILPMAGAGILEWDWKLLPLLNFILLVDRNNFFILN